MCCFSEWHIRLFRQLNEAYKTISTLHKSVLLFHAICCLQFYFMFCFFTCLHAVSQSAYYLISYWAQFISEHCQKCLYIILKKKYTEFYSEKTLNWSDSKDIYNVHIITVHHLKWLTKEINVSYRAKKNPNLSKKYFQTKVFCIFVPKMTDCRKLLLNIKSIFCT